jgi:hypothetical protein
MMEESEKADQDQETDRGHSRSVNYGHWPNAQHQRGAGSCPDDKTQDNNCDCTGLIGSDGSILIVRVYSAGYDSDEEECHESCVCDRDCDSNRQNRSHGHTDSFELWALKAYEDASKDKSQHYKSLHDANLGERDKTKRAERP